MQIQADVSKVNIAAVVICGGCVSFFFSVNVNKSQKTAEKQKGKRKSETEGARGRNV